MEILSISMDKDTLDSLGSIQKRLGFRSRSKMLRSAMHSLLKEYGEMDGLSGIVESVFVLTYKEPEKNHVSDMLHRFEDNIRTELHQHHSGTCIDILNIYATAKQTRDFFMASKRNKCIYSVSYSLINASNRT